MATALPMAGDAQRDQRGEALRLLWLIDSLTMGGAESLALSFAREASNHNVELTICSRTSIDGNPLEKEIAETGVHVENLAATSLRDRTAYRRLLAIVRDRKIDVIHAHLAYSAIWGALASRRSGTPMVATLHVAPPDRAPLRERMRQRLLTALLNRFAARVVMVSAAQRRSWGAAFPDNRVTVIHNGIPFEEDAIATRHREGGEPFRILTVAVLREGKGIEVLIEAIRLVRERGESVECTIAGDGPMRDEWEKRAEGLPFRWLGFRRDVPALMRETDLFVLPTLADAFPTVLLEAMAAGVPIVASDVGGVPEIVDPPETGWLVLPGDARALADAIVRAAREDDWRESAGPAARRRFEAKFTIGHWFERLEQLYREVVQ